MTTKRPYPESWRAARHRAPRVATLSDGEILVLREPGFERVDQAILHRCAPGLAREGFEGDGVRLVGPCDAAFACAAGAPLSAGMWVDPHGRLWLAWSDGTSVSVRRTREAATNVRAVADPAAWESQATGPADHGPCVHLGSGALHPTDPDTLLLSVLGQPSGASHLLCVGGSTAHAIVHAHPQNHAASMAVAPDGSCVHLVWATEDLRIIYQKTDLPLDPRPSAPVPFDVWRGCHDPDVATNGEQVVVAYTGHMQHIKYGWYDGGEWHLDEHLTTLHPRFHETLEHSPWFWTDANGAVHLSFVCLTRSLVFDSKWLGDRFSDPQPVEGLFHPSTFVDEVRVRAERISVDRHSGAMLLSSPFLPDRHGVYTPAIEAIAMSPGEPLLMFDTDAIDELVGGAVSLETMQDDPAGPVFEPTESDNDFDGSRVMSGGTVLKDGDRYRMWYGAVGLRAEPDAQWYDQVYVGYAESDDGAHWERIDTGNGHTYRGRPAPHRLRNVDHNACVFIDPADDSSRRYKAIKFESRAQRFDRVHATGEGGYLGLPRRAWLSTSPDGLRWEREEVTVDFPGVEPYGFQPQGAIYDPCDPDPARRYKAAGFTSMIGRRRGATLACSPDCRLWTVAERTPVLDSMMAVTPVRPAGPYGQLHDATIARCGRYLLVFYQYQFDGERADIRLAWSRNGERFRFAFPETPLVALGAPGAWNSAYLMNSSFVEDGDRMFLYYGANSDAPYETVHGMPIRRMCAGRSAAVRDRFVGAAPAKTGTPLRLTSAPVGLPSGETGAGLAVNARLGAGASLRVSLLEADGRDAELPGFGLADCVPASGDSTRHRIRWRGTDSLPPAGAPVRLRVEVAGGPADALYGLGVQP